jgi:hypothetical protein
MPLRSRGVSLGWSLPEKGEHVTRFASISDLAGKCEWEGGIAEAAGYGIKPDEMPEGHPELEALWTDLCKAQEMVELIEEKISKIFEQHDTN